MKKTMMFAGWVLLSVLGVAGAARGAELGMPAPELAIAQWVKGQPADLKAGRGKNIYVIEFWATWCGPCRTTIPHLTELQKKFKDQQVVVIGVSDEPAETIQPFVDRMGEKMSYTVAADQGRKTYAAYMSAFGERGIPHAFVVNKDGVIAWHGHPMAGLDEVVGEMVAGRFDLALAIQVERTAKLQEEYFKLVSVAGDNARAAELGRQVAAGFSKTPGALDNFAWRILTDRDIKARDLDLALRTAKSAYDLTRGTNASVMDTYARALFDTGKRDEAIKMQQAAVAACKDERQRIEFESSLKRYQRLAREEAK